MTQTTANRLGAVCFIAGDDLMLSQLHHHLLLEDLAAIGIPINKESSSARGSYAIGEQIRYAEFPLAMVEACKELLKVEKYSFMPLNTSDDLQFKITVLNNCLQQEMKSELVEKVIFDIEPATPYARSIIERAQRYGVDSSSRSSASSLSYDLLLSEYESIVNKLGNATIRYTPLAGNDLVTQLSVLGHPEQHRVKLVPYHREIPDVYDIEHLPLD